MNVLRLSLFAALPLWLASCSTGIDLIGERNVESDEFYLAGGEPHTGDAAIDEARYGDWMDEVDEFNDGDFDTPYAGPLSGRSKSQLWNRYTPAWTNGISSSFGNPYGYGNPYSSFGMGTGGFGSPYGMGHNNMAFMNGYDAWGNPIGGFGNSGFGFGNPYAMGGMGGNGWGYDPWGGGYWGVPNGGYYGGSGYGYNPYFGNMGAYGNPWCGNASSGSSGGVITFTPPRPRPRLGQYTGADNGTSSGGGGQAGVSGSTGNSGSASGHSPAVSRTTDRANTGIVGDQNRDPEAEQQRLRSDREAAERRALERQRARRQMEREAQQNVRDSRKAARKANTSSNGRWAIDRQDSNEGSPSAPRQERTSPSLNKNTGTPSPSRESTRPSNNTNSRPSSPRPSNSRSGSSRGGRGG